MWIHVWLFVYRQHWLCLIQENLVFSYILYCSIYVVYMPPQTLVYIRLQALDLFQDLRFFFISTWPKGRCQQWKVFKKCIHYFIYCSQQIFMTIQKQNKAKNRVEMAIRVEMFIATCKLFTMRFFNVKVVSHSTSTVNAFIPW